MVIGAILILILILIVRKEGYHDSERSLTCMDSTLNGKKYCIRERSNPQLAVNLLSKTTEKMKTLASYVSENDPSNEIGKRFLHYFNPENISETLTTSEYTAYSENKGMNLAFCLNKRKDNNEELIDENTLMFAAIHEMAHIGTLSEGHTDEFWENFKYLLQKAVLLNIYIPVDYSKTNMDYCGLYTCRCDSTILFAFYRNERRILQRCKY